MYSQLIEYFSGKWEGVEKPYTDKKGNPLKANRHISPQNWFHSKGKPNLRKLSIPPQVPFAAKDWKLLYQFEYFDCFFFFDFTNL